MPQVNAGLQAETMATETTTERKTLLPGRWGQVREVLRDSLVNFFRENSLMVSASIAYYSLLALPLAVPSSGRERIIYPPL